MQLNSEVQRISINRNGSALFLVGLDGLYVMYLYGRTSTKESTIICRYNFLILVLYGYVFFAFQCVSKTIVLIVICYYVSFEMYILLYLRSSEAPYVFNQSYALYSWLAGGNYEFSGIATCPFLKKINSGCSIFFENCS